MQQEDTRFQVTYGRNRAAQTRKDAAGSILRSTQRKHLVDWGYPRTGPRTWAHASKTRSTLTPGLTSFFRGNRSAVSQTEQRSAEATLFRSGTKQVEDAVLSLTTRRQELEQDIKSLEVCFTLTKLEGTSPAILPTDGIVCNIIIMNSKPYADGEGEAPQNPDKALETPQEWRWSLQRRYADIAVQSDRHHSQAK